MQWTFWLETIRHACNPSGRGRRRKAVCQQPAEALEDRSLLSVTSFFISGQLSVSSDGSDDITIRTNPFNPNLVQVLANGSPVTSLPMLQANQIKSIVVEGGDGPNTIDLSLITSTRFTQNPAISVDGKQGDDIINGSLNLNDTLLGGHGNDLISAGSGVNIIDGGDGNDTLSGGAGNDSVLGNDGNDDIDGGVGNDTVIGGNGLDTIDGGGGNDSMTGGDGADLIDGDTPGFSGAGNDTIFAGNGNDTIRGGDGDDLLNGDGQNDSILGGNGNDSISAGNGSDFVQGGTGNDNLNGNSGNDTIEGQAGNDLINGGSDHDLVRGDDEF
ncbi:MAG TPA: calcium-binding protein, partial [Planctomycetaceae bacterium]|nr:calcium-binding protein [Planctomycetaceae bacterium]